MDRAAAITAVVQLADRLATLVESAADPHAAVPWAPGWTVRDVAAHVATVIPRYAQGPEHLGTWVDTPAALPALNTQELDEIGDLPLSDIAAAVRVEVASLTDQIGRYGDHQPVYRFHGGGQVSADAALGILAGELLVHGWDIAKTLKHPWTMSAPHVDLVVTGLEPVLPGWVHPDRAEAHSAAYEIRIRGGGRHTWRFTDGRLDVAPPEGTPIDCHLSGAPEALLLVMYHRRSPWWAAGTARVTAWGRRPWLAFSFADRFWNP